ncbi:Cytochrome P450 monooxygenase patI [Colletotrichum orbiculare MAFF 240422]|uniref:Cytochrome P450 monooxygenase patI n=1 Tax=Colletotrichum orbiculare (strain 104-T / ATCC 96160 / CBS 514.97 / LARS 414 / MAFF 240422) TaxID=1213857 RepID=A0A484FM32_COLOR|nr:Cytochrome P450 monooxygenase patI [Colletotrichum orbiculare MAFF 240422]
MFGRREKDLPPGPPTVPILGNAHLIPTTWFSAQLKTWAEQYGSVYSLKVGQSTMVVLNDRRAVHELLVKQGAYYNDRPVDAQAAVAARHENTALMHEGPMRRAERKIAATYFAPKNLDGVLRPVQEAEVNRLMFDLLTKPEQFAKSAVYIAMDAISKALAPGSYLPIEQFPILKLVPDRWLMGRERGKRFYGIMTGIWAEARQRVDKRRSAGDKRESLIDMILDEKIKSGVSLSYSGLNNFLGGVHMGASDTTATATLTTILFLAKHPDFQEKARIELDRVCGTERMPSWSDFKDLPYVNCILKEGLRMRPIVPSGVPHRSKEDRWYDGMLIPADSTIFIPPATLNYDENYVTDSSTYNPDRYLPTADRLAPELSASSKYEERDHYSYGAGRRMCVGIHLAERSQWRMIAQMLWAFNIEPEIGPDGEPMEVKTGYDVYEDGFLNGPKDYMVRIVPRSEKHAEVVRATFAETEPDLARWE